MEKRLKEQARELLDEDRKLTKNQAHSRQILSHLTDPELGTELPQVAGLQGLELARRIGEQASDVGLDLPALLQHDLSGDLAGLEANLEQAWALQRLHNQWHGHWQSADAQGESLRERLARLRHQREERYRQLEEQRRRKRHEIERLRSRRVTYPPYVERALAALREQCPQADPRVLCDHVEVRDPRWQAAFEGYLGGARFSILVEPDFEAEAIRIVRRLPGRDNRARIVQGDQARRDAERSQLHPDSIVHVLEFTHAVARHYLSASYGSLLRVDSAEKLRHTRRGLTADGMGSGNYSMYRCDLPDAELVFGAAARERALAAKQAELEGLETDWQAANDRMQQAAALLQAVDGLAPLSYAEGLAGMLESRRELQKLENLLSQLDLGEFEDIEQRLQELRRNESELNTRQAELNQRLGELRGLLEASEARCDRLSRLQEETGAEAERDEANLRAIATVWPSLDPEPLLARAEQEARDLDPAACAAERDAAEAGLRACERSLSQTLEAHNQRCRPGDAIVYQGFEGAYDDSLFRHICGLRQDIDRVYNLLRNNILVDKHAQLRQLKESFNHAFVSHLCHAIYQAIGDGKRQIELLNRELQHHRFGSDRETFRFASDWIPEYRDYARFFEEVVRSPGLGDDQTLFEAELSERSQRVLDQLMAMLLDEDEHKAMRELERIADYRNYRRYEIYKEVEGKPPIALSEYGTGSGGQLETPAYIIRSAAITSAFRFAEGQTHLRMVLVDEAFSKMDEARSREVIGYLTEALGLQLIFIMPSNKCGPYMDLISNEFVFAKCPSDGPRGQLQTRVLVDRKQCNQERIRDLWAQHRRTVHQQAELDFMEAFE